MWLPSPSVMAWSLLSSESVRFSTSSSQIMFKIWFYRQICNGLLLDHTILHLFTIFLLHYFSDFLWIFYPKNYQVYIFWQKTLQTKVFVLWQWKFFSIILKAGHTHSNNLKALQLYTKNFICHIPSVFIFVFFRKKSHKKSFSLMVKEFFSISPMVSRKDRVLRLLWQK
jgi:hypothetical protein